MLLSMMPWQLCRVGCQASLQGKLDQQCQVGVEHTHGAPDAQVSFAVHGLSWLVICLVLERCLISSPQGRIDLATEMPGDSLALQGTSTQQPADSR